MIRYFLILLAFVSVVGSCNNPQPENKPAYVLVIHGGAGTILKKNMTQEKEKQYNEVLNAALKQGEDVLKSGGTSLDAVTRAVMVMEDSPLFNAGKGAVFTAEGVNEMDASIMDGLTLNAGAVAGVSRVKNPVLAARAVMETTPHVMLAGAGADAMAELAGLDMVDPDYFFTESRWQNYLEAKQKNEKHGTVGAVALDTHGNLAAATSTGGMTYKMKGRIGDSPVIGAGTYADNKSCAISATGHGEFFIRNVVAYDISALMKYSGVSLQQAADEVIKNKLKNQNAEGGIVAVDKDGNFAMTFNSAGMYRGYITAGGKSTVLIFGEN